MKTEVTAELLRHSRASLRLRLGPVYTVSVGGLDHEECHVRARLVEGASPQSGS
jgi:hypothetical protein